jgi:hypothetical protein
MTLTALLAYSMYRVLAKQISRCVPKCTAADMTHGMPTITTTFLDHDTMQ